VAGLFYSGFPDFFYEMRTNGFVGKENMGKTDFVGGVVQARRRGCGLESCDLIPSLYFAGKTWKNRFSNG
jgi:hypothetical protein